MAAVDKQRSSGASSAQRLAEPVLSEGAVSQATRSGLDAEVAELRAAVEQAHFEDAEARASGLLQLPSLRAQQRNDTLELLAIAQLAARKESLAQLTLAELFARDPEHPQRMRDPGPSVENFFARVRAQARESVAVSLHVSALRDVHARVLVEVELQSGRDAVASVHVFSPARADATLGTQALSERAIEPIHVVADVDSRPRLTLELPPLGVQASVVELYVEARAPSGYVLGQSGASSAPLHVRLEPDRTRGLEPEPVRRAWWLWTSLAVGVSAIVITGAALAH
ncbi:MAG: hypothetical protein JWN48_1120 [Myxococcaceae bacterium]|nr:hypothetical protein [Myxococcaceae bacterium]